MREKPYIAGRYELGGLLGSGGMGSVHRAWDTRLDREVAIKVLGRHHAGTPEFVERFEREVKSVASLDHPNVVRVFDSGRDDDGSPYMAMELLHGGTLKDRIRRAGPLPPREAARVVLQVAEALGAAHEAGIVHRDVKPENVLLTREGRAKVADFGIARATEATAMTHTSMVLGTAPYLSPEQARGEPVGPASDLYSLGVVLYEALTGRTPFGTGEHVSPLAIAMKHCTEPAPSPRASNRKVPRPLELVTLVLMRKQPDERYASAAALADDLAAFLRGEKLSSAAAMRLASSSEAARTQALRRAPAAPARRRRKLLPVMAVALAGVLALAFSPLVPMQTPAALVESTVPPDTRGVDRAVSPVLRSLPDVPEAPEKEQAKGDGSEGRERKPAAPTGAGDTAKASSSTPSTPPETVPEPAAPPDASAAPTAPSDAPAEVTAGSASAGASASASASASAGASAASSPVPSGASAVGEEGSAAASEAAPEQTPEPVPPSSAPAVEEAPEPVPPASAPAVEEAPEPAPPASAPAVEETSAPAAEPGASPSVPGAEAAGSAPAEAPEVEAPEVETPEVEAPDEAPGAEAAGSAPAEAPEVEAPEVETPEVEAPDF